MQDHSHAFLNSLLETPSASGFEQAIQEVVRGWARHYADEVRTDSHGNVIAVRYPAANAGDGHRVMLAGHCDQIALMVLHIDDNGFLYVQPIGGWDMQILLGQYLTVWTKSGPITGIVSRRAIHLMTSDERNKVPQFTDVWVDVGARDGKEARELVTYGDSVTFALGYRPLRNNLAASPAMDDKVGVWVVMEALRLLHGKDLQVPVYCVSTVQEEIGLRGATTSTYGIHPTVGVAVDVCHATDTPGNDKKQLGETELGDGPVLFRGPNINPHVFERMHRCAVEREIGVQVRGTPRGTGTDANVMQLTREGVATGLVGIPNRYMHSPVEVVNLDDLDRAAALLAEFCLSLTPQIDWTPCNGERETVNKQGEEDMSEGPEPEEIHQAVDCVVEELLAAAGVLEPPVDAVTLARQTLRLVLPAGRKRAVGQPEPSEAQKQYAAAQQIGKHLEADVLSRLGVDPADARGLTGASLTNLVADRLLTPTCWFLGEARTADYDLPALMRRFRTAGPELIAWRLLDLPEPCIITVIDNDHVQRRRSNAWRINRELSEPERRCQQYVHTYSRAHRLSADGWTVQGWPLHEADWKREVLRSVVEEA